MRDMSKFGLYNNQFVGPSHCVEDETSSTRISPKLLPWVTTLLFTFLQLASQQSCKDYLRFFFPAVNRYNSKDRGWKQLTEKTKNNNPKKIAATCFGQVHPRRRLKWIQLGDQGWKHGFGRRSLQAEGDCLTNLETGRFSETYNLWTDQIYISCN